MDAKVTYKTVVTLISGRVISIDTPKEPYYTESVVHFFESSDTKVIVNRAQIETIVVTQIKGE